MMCVGMMLAKLPQRLKSMLKIKKKSFSLQGHFIKKFLQKNVDFSLWGK